MKATLTFNLDDPDDRMAHLRCVKSLDMAIALFEIKNNSGRYAQDVEQYSNEIQNALGNINIDELIS